MNKHVYELATVALACAGSKAASGADDVLSSLARLWPELSFTTVLTRGGWFRSGGVVDIDKQRVADSLRQWAEAKGTDDLAELLDACLQTPLFATRQMGKTYYLTASTGPAAADFVQLEVEQLQEVLERYLSDPDWLPANLEEFVDPLEYAPLQPEPVGEPRLVFRRLFAAGEMLDALPLKDADGLRRFLVHWGHSSAAQSGHFCSHWVFGIREWVDSDDEACASARVVSTHAGQAPGRFELPAGGAELANRIHGYDHQVGYPMAWFFHMVGAAGVPDAVGRRVARDHDEGFDYLPARDLQVLRDWVANPYRA